MYLKSFFYLGLLALILGLGSCTKDQCKTTTTYIKYDPIYLNGEDYRKPLMMLPARPLKKPGKLYIYRNFLLINEQLEGIHVFDNSNPAAPVKIGFINIIGNLDMAIKGNILYADNYTDLLTIDISNWQNVQLLDRDQDVFPIYGQDAEGRSLVAYHKEEVTGKVNCSELDALAGGWGNPQLEDQGVSPVMVGSSNGSNGSNARTATAVGLGGSMARFTITGDYLYTVDEANLRVFNISQLDNPSYQGPQNIGWATIETIFPHENNLFIGSNSGMYIYSLADPAAPQLTGTFEHATACDPVYVEGNRAYVTLRGGGICDSYNNQLDVVDVSNLSDPQLITSHPMHNPHGLSLKNNLLYLCDGDEGLKIFDASDDYAIGSSLMAQDASFSAYDVIASPFDDLALVIGPDGFYQYDISNPNQLQRISSILVEE